MEKETIGFVSGLVVIASAVPYTIRTWQRKIHPNPASWFLWSIIGFALLVTYKSSGAESNIWPVVFTFTNPLVISLILVRNGEHWGRFTRVDWICFMLGLASLGFWFFVKNDLGMAQYALYTAIAADAFAAIPTIVFVWGTPGGDRPFAWGLFSIAYGLALFAIPEPTVANYALPIYMCSASFIITIPMIRYRIRERIPLGEWV